MAKTNYKNDRIEIIDPIQAHLENAADDLKNELSTDPDFYLDSDAFTQQYIAHEAVAAKVKAENRQLIEDAKLIKKDLDKIYKDQIEKEGDI